MTLRPVLVALRGDPATLEEAEALLTHDESLHLQSLRVPKRRADWLLGRLAAKLAAARMLGGRVTPSTIAVVTGPSGAPCTRLDGLGLPGPEVSISHSGGCAVALAAPHRVGVDLEQLRPMPPGSARFYLTDEEQAWLAGEPWGPRGPLAVWALKEAAYKALHGRCAVLTRLALEPATPGRARLHEGGEALTARLVEGAHLCLAAAVPEEQAGALEALDLDEALAGL